MQNDWYLVQFKPNSHKIAERNLHRLGFETFLPMQTSTQRKTTKFINVMKPLFPGYMFVLCDTTQQPWRTINSTIGVSRIVSFGNKPVKASLDLVQGLQARCDEAGELKPLDAFEPGEQVTISAGPFANFIATVEKMDADQRVWVLLDLMGQKSRVRVSSDQLIA